MGAMMRAPNVSGFTLIELLVAISVIAVLVTLLVPALGRARDRVRVLGCLTNQRQITAAMTSYAQGAIGGHYHPDLGEGGTDDLSYLYLGGFLGSYDVARCPGTSNVIEVKSGRFYDPKTERFIEGTDYTDLIVPASHAHDESGGHSYELFHTSSPGQFPNGLTLDEAADITLSLVGTQFNPSETFIAIDNDDDPLNGGINVDGLFGYNNLPDRATNNHADRGGNVGFLDGSARFIGIEEWMEVMVASTHIGAVNYARAREINPSYRESARTDGVTEGKRHYFVNE